jgi:hypothetical protein
MDDASLFLLPLREKVSPKVTDEGSRGAGGLASSELADKSRDPSSDPLRGPPSPARGEGTKAIRNAGFVACLVGVLVMLGGRFAHGAPAWLVSVGVGLIVLGWGLFAWSMVRRAAMARAVLKDSLG